MSNNNEYMRKFMKSWYDRRHADAIARLGGCCARCGSVNDLQFDHIDPATKSIIIAKMWTASKARFEIEIVKCQLLCPSCHQQKTCEDRGLKVAKGTHGTLSAYRYCKCEECKRANREYHAQRRASQTPLTQRKSTVLLTRESRCQNSQGVRNGSFPVFFPQGFLGWERFRKRAGIPRVPRMLSARVAK